MRLKEIRTSKGLTQAEASKILNVSLRSYKDYENNHDKMKTNKYEYLCEKLQKYGNVNYSFVYVAVKEDIPELKNQLEKLM